jgi:proteic killer suppression protein
MIKSFANQGTIDIALGKTSKAARQLLPKQLHAVARRKLARIDFATQIDDLKVPPGNRLEKLSGNRSGQWSIRINDQYRICFSWVDSGDAEVVEICDYH